MVTVERGSQLILKSGRENEPTVSFQSEGNPSSFWNISVRHWWLVQVVFISHHANKNNIQKGKEASNEPSYFSLLIQYYEEHTPPVSCIRYAIPCRSSQNKVCLHKVWFEIYKQEKGRHTCSSSFESVSPCENKRLLLGQNRFFSYHFSHWDVRA